jgi:hypothetical protein
MAVDELRLQLAAGAAIAIIDQQVPSPWQLHASSDASLVAIMPGNTRA